MGDVLNFPSHRIVRRRRGAAIGRDAPRLLLLDREPGERPTVTGFRLRGGQLTAVRCPFCAEIHLHGAGSGARVAHCAAAELGAEYQVRAVDRGPPAGWREELNRGFRSPGSPAVERVQVTVLR